MTKRSVEFHKCPISTSDPVHYKPGEPEAPTLQLLDAYMPGGDFGISDEVFCSSFVSCMDCHQYLTITASQLHNCVLEKEYEHLSAAYYYYV
jgi:hypothetical protein